MTNPFAFMANISLEENVNFYSLYQFLAFGLARMYGLAWLGENQLRHLGYKY